MRRIERDEGSSRVIAAEGPRGFRARGDVAPRKSDRVHNGSRENIVVGHPDDGRRRARRRRGETTSDRPAARGISSPSPTARARSSGVSVGGRARTLRPRGDSWPAPRPRNVVQRMGIRAGDARGGGGLLSRARGGVADARTRENGRRQGCHVRNARRVDGRARWMCCQSSGEKRGDLNKEATRCIKIGGKITLNYSMTGYPYAKFSHPTTACFVSARPTVPSCLMSAPSAGTLVSDGMHSFSSARFASRGGHPPHATPGAAFISADAGDARRRPGGCTVGDRGIVTRVVRAPRSRRV